VIAGVGEAMRAGAQSCCKSQDVVVMAVSSLISHGSDADRPAVAIIVVVFGQAGSVRA